MKWVVLTTIIAAGLLELPSPVVRTSSGLVRGTVGKNGRYHQFLGVPYGTVDERNRFQAPLPPPTWEGIYDAIDENHWCPQRFMGSFVNIGRPDCLKLSIYTPKHASPKHPLPVMVFIHGGCFFEGVGSTFLYSGEYFTDYEVIYIGINYRLSVEGFLCLGIKEAPGNAGLKDQIAALKWIKKNIRSFGGDPDNVTLFGESAGAVSISYLNLIPAAKGLFHKVILQSGSSVVPWGIQHDPISLGSTLAKEFGYDTKDPYEIYDILSRKTHFELIRAIKYAKHKEWISADTLFVPCIEKEIAGVDAMITEYPTDIIKSGNYTKVPMMIGYNDNEGIIFVSLDYGRSLKNAKANDILRNDLVFPNETDKNDTINKIQSFYFSSGKDEQVMDMVDLYSDMHFKFPSVFESDVYGKTNDQPIFYYLFKYSGFLNVPKFYSLFFGTKGACHADEVFYMMRPRVLPTIKILEETMTSRMLMMWSNFAKFSTPIPKPNNLLPIEWLPSREWNPRALIIDENLTIGPWFEESSMKLWNDTYINYRRQNYGIKQYSLYKNPKTYCNCSVMFNCNETFVGETGLQSVV